MEMGEQLVHTRKGCPNKIRNSFGVRDVHKLIRKNHWYNIGRTISEGNFYAIIRSINRFYADEIANGREVVFPFSMGRLMLRKYKVGAEFVKDKLKITYAPNWSATWKLWSEDEEARKKKTILYYDNSYIYRVYYDKWNAKYENKSFYLFSLNTFIQDALSANIKQGKVDTI